MTMNVLRTIAAALLLPIAGWSADETFGMSFDAGLPPEKAAELLVTRAPQPVTPGSWLRLRGMHTSAVIGPDGIERPLFKGMPAVPSVDERRAALRTLRDAGYRLVAFVRWAPGSWPGGYRKGLPLRRLPIDLREAFERCRLLAATYGDLIDYWEIDNEPDISFVEENPETYAAFLKACYAGIKRGATDDGGRMAEGGGRRTASGSGTVSEAHQTSLVLMAPLALPPGAYFEAFVRNAGLSYTDGFNYHYYGYSEDFTGIYRQFEAAVRELSDDGRRTAEVGGRMTVFSTRFLPNSAGWPGWNVAGFRHGEEESASTMKALIERPLASEELPMRQQGRWLATEGVTVEETTDGWRFIIHRNPSAPSRARAVELPLPPDWQAPIDGLLNFEYRMTRDVPDALTAEDGGRTADLGRRTTEGGRLRTAEGGGEKAEGGGQKTAVGGRTSDGSRPPSVVRSLPIFLTEYGYGGLRKEARLTADGRERQRRWFASVSDQVQALGIEGAMAFYLMPYLEQDSLEFGLLMNATSGPAAPQKWDEYGISPALEELLARADTPLQPRRWTISTPPPVDVVIDFIAGAGLGLAKSYGGYFLEGEHGRTKPGEGMIVVYNFGAAPVTGFLTVEGETWTLRDGGTETGLKLGAGERKLVPVRVFTKTQRFELSLATARFTAGEVPAIEPAIVASAPATAAKPPITVPPQPKMPLLPRDQIPELEIFEPYFRTANGNLYQTWPRLQAISTWQRYMEQTGNFTPAFYGRHNLPWRFEENRPISLVFRFHPKKLPVVFEVKNPQVVKFAKTKP